MLFDSLYCGKWRKYSRRDLDIDQTMPNVDSPELFSYTTICLSFKWIEPLFLELSCTQTDTQTHRHQDKQIDMSTLLLRLINCNYKNYFNSLGTLDITTRYK